jgi:Fic family protein
MEIQARRRGRRTYYYLSHSYRESGRVRKIEKYLGASLPTDLSTVKEELRTELFARRWAPSLEEVTRSYRANRAKMPPEVREEQDRIFATKFTYDSNRIEGSSLTFRETSLLLNDGITPSNRPLADVRESINHQRVFLEAIRTREPLDLDLLLSWHRDLFTETKPRIAGVIRPFRVGISGSRFEPPLPIELDMLLREFFDWFRVAWKRAHPVVLAAQTHLRLVTIHPFGDGNGRVTRIAMNYVLRRKECPMLDIPYVGRAGYYRTLERTQLGKDESAFLRWFLRLYLESNTRTLRRSRTSSA